MTRGESLPFTIDGCGRSRVPSPRTGLTLQDLDRIIARDRPVYGGSREAERKQLRELNERNRKFYSGGKK